ncbi:hypothetical protein SKAU_G00213910 [Synaphobranchus kaupii]|uniref:TBC1 domain family member 31 n=1 Tax=Synaphobranchus kaupii TaxID=118154 RepID=A0A9Q1IUU2_SYNKA|nr:hypothetical protein SKAU_G00213910 [Synaphobranchus kaupii]
MQTTDIGNKESGKIWYRNPGTSPSNGTIVNIIRSTGGHRSKRVRFLHVAFDTTGEEFLAGDHHGNIYVFDVIRNRFRLIQKTAQACTALAFSLRRTTEYLVALADYSIKCFDKDTKQLVSWMRGHECAVSSVSVHSSGRYAITTSADTAQLWDLDTFQRKRKLNVRQSVGIQKVFFLPLSNTILSCFNDDSIFAWESDTLCCKYQLPVPQEGPRLYYRAFAVTRDGRTLAAGGRSNLLHLWSLDSRQLLRVIQMPPKVRTVRQLEFLPDNFDGGSSQTLGVLSQDGIMRFINIQTCKLLFDIGTLDDAITSVAVSPSGHHIVSVMDSGGLNIFSVQALTQEFNKPPPPLVKVVTGVNVEDGQRAKVRTGSVQRPARTSGRRVKARVLRPPALPCPEDKENELPDGLNKRRLQALLKAFGEYPAKYRMFVWRSLLRLPENHSAFNSLIDKGIHSAFLTMHERYPIKSQKLHRGLQRVLSALTYWSAIFGETDYLPLMAFPFVKLFQNNPLVCFEVIATVLVNWCQHWFEYFPNPPLNVLSMVENALAHHDKELLQHLINCGVTSQLYVWPLLETLFSEVLTREEWLKLFDNVFSNHPAFLLMTREDFEYFFHHRNHLDVTAVIKETYRLMDTTPPELHPRSMLADFEPLTRGQYPVFNKYPTFIVEHQSQERERIRQQEMEYLRERQMVQELQAETVRRQAADQAWYTQQELLQEAEEQRRHILQEEENKLAEQRTRLGAMKRELKLKELNLIDAARRRFLKHQHDQKRVELRRLDDEIQRKMVLRDQETAITVQDLELRQMELEAQRGLFEQQLAKEQERVTQEVKAEVEVRRHVAELEDSAFQQALDADSALNVKSKKLLEESLAEAEQLNSDADWKADVMRRLEWVGVEQERHHQELSRLNQETLDKEEQLVLTMKEVEGKKWEDVMEKRARLAEGREASQGDILHWEEPEERGQHLDRLRSSQEEQLQGQWKLDLRSPCSTRGLLQKPSPTHSRSKNICLNSKSPPSSSSSSNSSDSAQFSLDRGRRELENKERDLMRDVRELRRRLADRSRNENSLTYSASIQPSITCGSFASEDTITNARERSGRDQCSCIACTRTADVSDFAEAPEPVMNLEGGGLVVGWFLRPRQVGKVRRRVQEMRYPSAMTSELDLSHNESARLATDALLDRGLAAYREALVREGEVDFLSEEEKGYILGKARDLTASCYEVEEEQDISTSLSGSSETYFPVQSDSEPPGLDYGWPVADWAYHLQGKPRVDVYFQSESSTRIKDLLREYIRKATTLLAIVMDTFTDVEILCDILEAARKRGVSVYLLLDHMNLHLFVEMCENLHISSSHLTKMSIRSVQGETYCAKSGRKFTGQIKEKFVIMDCTHVLAGPFSFTWLSWQVHRSMLVLFKGSGIKPFDLEFRRLYAASKAVPEFPNTAPPMDIVRPLGCRQLPCPVHTPTAAAATPLQADRTLPQYAAPPRPHDTGPTPVPTPQKSYVQAPRAQYVRQTQPLSQPIVRLRSLNDNIAGNLGWRLRNFYGGALGRPNGQFLRPTAGYSFLNKPDTKPQ